MFDSERVTGITDEVVKVSPESGKNKVRTGMFDLRKPTVPETGSSSLTELEDQLQLLKQEKCWLENAILARVEYLNNS